MNHSPKNLDSTEKIDIELIRLNSRINNLISDNYDKYVNTHTSMDRLNKQSEQMHQMVQTLLKHNSLIKSNINSFFQSIDEDLLRIHSKKSNLEKLRSLELIKQLPEIAQRLLDTNEFERLIDYHNFFKDFYAKNGSVPETLQNALKSIESEMNALFNKMYSKFDQKILIFDESVDYYLGIAGKLRAFDYKNELLSTKILTFRRLALEGEMRGKLKENKSFSEFLESLEDIKLEFCSFLRRFEQCFVGSMEPTERERVSLISFARDILESLLQSTRLHLSNKPFSLPDFLSLFTKIHLFFSETQQTVPQLKFSSKWDSVFEKMIATKLNEQFQSVFEDFDKQFSSFDQSANFSFYCHRKIQSKIESLSESLSNILPIFSLFVIDPVDSLESKTTSTHFSQLCLNALKVEVENFFFGVARKVCYEGQVFECGIDGFKQTRMKLDFACDVPVLEEMNSKCIFTRFQFLTFVQNYLSLEVYIELARLEGQSKAKISLETIFENCLRYLLLLHVKIESSGLTQVLEKCLEVQFERLDEDFHGEYEPFELVLVDNAVALRLEISQFCRSLEMLLEIAYGVSLKQYPFYEKRGFYDSANKRGFAKVNRVFCIQKNLPSSFFNIWKATLISLINTEKLRNLTTDRFRQIQVNLAVMNDCFPQFLCKRDVAELNSLLVEILEYCHSFVADKNCYLKKAELDSIFKKYNLYV